MNEEKKILNKYIFRYGIFIHISDTKHNNKKTFHISPQNWDEIEYMDDTEAYNTIVLLNKFESTLIRYEFNSKRFKKQSN